ncbi:hypothetical protein GC096_26060 [Paenibacillus sp. LMG 31461]|uniref:Fibronectin type-III domain-containing protein n=1 Tax=Paenibacillus plantarum TaxID=2654975 RepID=A0ABX1XGG5_9BACL|nr:fibronectin type III domain-containing protein [Paenibacillus plantarum]NOU67511.1 hypothetical protein [Paenibacillus plantarum]
MKEKYTMQAMVSMLIIIVLLAGILPGGNSYASYLPSIDMPSDVRNNNNTTFVRQVTNNIDKEIKIDSNRGINPAEMSLVDPNTEEVITSRNSRVNEIVGKREKNSKVFIDSTGKESVVSSVYSLHYNEGGKWANIDTRLIEDRSNKRYTHKMKANNFEVDVSDKAREQRVTFSVKENSITYQAKNMNSVTGQVYGNSIIYRDAWTSTDMLYQIENDQMKLELLLKDKKAPKEFQFDVEMTELKYKLNVDGSILFFDDNNQLQFKIPSPWVKDSSSEVLRHDKLRVEVKENHNTITISYILDDSNLQYPVVIDPTTRVVLPVKPMISIGYDYMLAVRDDATIWGWGYNDDTFLDQSNSPTPILSPIQLNILPELTWVSQVAAGANHSVALRQDGTVWAWGYDVFCQIGTRDEWGQIQGLTDIVEISTKGNYNLAVKDDGTVWEWGYNFEDIGTCDPTQVNNLSGIVSVSAGWNHSLAVKNDGSLWAWGHNTYGQLGDGTTTTRLTPVQIIASGILSAAAGYNHSVAAITSGGVLTWGDNSFGQLGDGTKIGKLRPIEVKFNGYYNNYGPKVQVAAGDNHTLAAFNEDGEVFSWGANNKHQLGNSLNQDYQLSPMELDETIYNGYLTAGVDNSAYVKWGWPYNNYVVSGSNEQGQLANGTTEETWEWNLITFPNYQPNVPIDTINPTSPANLRLDSSPTEIILNWTPSRDNVKVVKYEIYKNGNLAGSVNGETTTFRIAGLDGGVQYTFSVKAFDAIGNQSLESEHVSGELSPHLPIKPMITSTTTGSTFAIKKDGTLWAWGKNTLGILGDGTTTDRKEPVQVKNLTGISQVSAGDKHIIALKNDGTVWAWGKNDYCQLGNSNCSLGQLIPVQIPNLNGVVSISARGLHSIAVKSDGTVWTWGIDYRKDDYEFQYMKQSSPTQVPQLSGVVEASAGGLDFKVLKNNGTVWIWGADISILPILVNGLDGIVALAGDDSYYAFAIKSDGTLWKFKRLSSTQGFQTVQVVGLNDIVSAHIGQSSSLAVSRDGSIWSWGTNAYGELGNGTQSDHLKPVKITSANSAFYIGVNKSYTYSSYAVDENGQYYAWGRNTEGQLGNGTLINSSYPIMVIGPNVNPQDIQAPSAPSNLTLITNGLFNVDLYWTNSIDNVGVAEYYIYDEDTLIAVVDATKTTYSARDLIGNATHTFTVVAKDSSGNFSTASNSISKRIPLHLRYYYDVSGRIDYIKLNTGKILKYNYDANGNLLNIQNQ